jgi:hypothetical protein
MPRAPNISKNALIIVPAGASLINTKYIHIPKITAPARYFSNV